MADLLNSLILSKYETSHHNNSQDSFHSVQEELPESNPFSQHNKQESPQEQINPSTTQIPTSSALQTNHQGYDIDTYLSLPVNAALLTSPITKSQPRTTESTPRNNAPSLSNPSAPLPSNPPPGYYLATLNQTCQLARLIPEFTIAQVPGKVKFTGQLKLGPEITITLDCAQANKKAVREQLARKALEAIEALNLNATKTSESGSLIVRDEAEGGRDRDAGGERNWIGLLQEYHQQIHSPSTPTYSFYTPNPLTHACVLILPPPLTLHAQQNPAPLTFGSPITPYTTKKGAQQAAAREAVKYFVGKGGLNGDGSVVKARRKINNSNRVASGGSLGQLAGREGGEGIRF